MEQPINLSSFWGKFFKQDKYLSNADAQDKIIEMLSA